VRIDGSNRKLCAKFNWNAGKECYTQKFDVVVPTPKPTPVPTPKPTRVASQIMTGTFVTNEGREWKDQTPFKLSNNEYVFGASEGGLFKMAKVDSFGQVMEFRYTRDVSELSELTVAIWNAADSTQTVYTVESLKFSGNQGGVSVEKPTYAQCMFSSSYGSQPPGEGYGQGLLDSERSWSAQQNREGEWWQMDVGYVANIAGVVTQGRKEANQRVTSYTVQVSSNGNDFEDVDGGRVFIANMKDVSDKDHKIENRFASLVQARYVKIVVKTWKHHISMRSAVLVPEAQ